MHAMSRTIVGGYPSQRSKHINALGPVGQIKSLYKISLECVAAGRAILRVRRHHPEAIAARDAIPVQGRGRGPLIGLLTGSGADTSVADEPRKAKPT